LKKKVCREGGVIKAKKTGVIGETICALFVKSTKGRKKCKERKKAHKGKTGEKRLSEQENHLQRRHYEREIFLVSQDHHEKEWSKRGHAGIYEMARIRWKRCARKTAH